MNGVELDTCFFYWAFVFDDNSGAHKDLLKCMFQPWLSCISSSFSHRETSSNVLEKGGTTLTVEWAAQVCLGFQTADL